LARIYIYVVDRDFGFAPNPFHGVCTLATCKPGIRRTAQVGDWVFGMGGSRLKATGRCVFAMRIDECLTFDEYWNEPRFRAKRPIRNGSRRMMVGDNIYNRRSLSAQWHQEDSHHSLPDGQPNPSNIANDTQTNRVLVSSHFVYFGSLAPTVPSEILNAIGYKNGRAYRVFFQMDSVPLIEWLNNEFGANFGTILGDPFDFDHSAARYSALDNRVTSSVT